MKVFLNSKLLYKCQAFQLISRLPEVPKLCWFSLHFSSSAFPSIYWPNCKNSRILQPHLPQQFVTVSTVTSPVADLGPVELDCTVRGCGPQGYHSEVVHMKGSWEIDPGMPLSLLNGAVNVSSVFLKQWFLYFSYLYNKEREWYYPHVIVTHVLDPRSDGAAGLPIYYLALPEEGFS